MKKFSSQYEDEEFESHVSSDEGKISDRTYYEEASCEDNDEIFYSSHEEDIESTCSASYESNANWEEERDDGSDYSYVSKGINYFSKSESEVSFQNYKNQLEVESCEE